MSYLLHLQYNILETNSAFVKIVIWVSFNATGFFSYLWTVEVGEL